jgi:hypothetical protein
MTFLSARSDDPFLDYAHRATALRARRRAARGVVLAIALVALVLAATLVITSQSGPNAMTAAAQIRLGARTTLAQHTAVMTISGDVSSDGQSIPITGSGYVNLATSVESVSMDLSSSGTAFHEQVLSDGANEYLQMAVNGQSEISQLLPGKTWLEIRTPTSTTSSAPSILAQLQVLTQEGNTVVPLGSSTIDGTAVTGYQVTFSAAALHAAAKRVASLNGVEAQSMNAALQSFAKNPPVLKLWLDASHLLRREEVSIGLSTASGTVSGDVTVDLSNYGTPFTVAPPAASTVGSFSSFLAAARAAG